jgi:hypothetical protein
MSGFMFGGSALALDVGAKNKTGISLERGDIVQIALLNADAADGFNAVIPSIANTTVGQLAPYGVVQAPPGAEISDGDDMIIRILGVTDVSLQIVGATLFTQDQVSAPNTAGAAGVRCTLAASATLTSTAATGGLQQVSRAHAVILGPTVTTTADGKRERVSCWFNGLP